MRYLIITLFFSLSVVILASFVSTSKKVLPTESVHSVLSSLSGEDSVNAINEGINGVSAKAGEDIIKYGFTTKNGKKVKKQSKHFVCTSCHNLVKEEVDLSVSIPEDRLQYALKNEIPFLQGTTLFGAVNRTSFYNDDYYKKYGDLVIDAKNDIRKAIQLCATECAQGRELKPWEIESILAYLWEIDLHMSDLNLSEVEYNFISKAVNDEANKEEAISLLQSKYLQGSPATFLNPPAERNNIKFDDADIVEGQHIYEKSCLYCHENQRYSYLLLDNTKMSFKMLSKKAKGYGRQSIYQVIRYGVPSYNWKKSYMPHYTAEKMSNNQLNNLRAYIEHKANE